MAKRSAVEQIVIEEKTVSDAIAKLIGAREKGELLLLSARISVLIGVRVIKLHGDLPVLYHLIPLIVLFDDCVYVQYEK